MEADRDDTQKLADAGVTERFDVSFQSDVDDLRSYFIYMERFRAILGRPSPIARRRQPRGYSALALSRVPRATSDAPRPRRTKDICGIWRLMYA